MPTVDPSVIDRIVWLSTAAAAAIAVVGTALAYAIHLRLRASARWKEVALPVTLLTVGTVYVVSAIAFIGLIRLQLPQRISGDQLSMSVVFVDPSFVQRIVPAGVIAVTWFCFTAIGRIRRTAV